MIKEKSIVLVKIDEEDFILLTDKISGSEKIHIEVIADNLNEFYPDVSEMTHFEKFDVLEKAIRAELKIETSVVGIDLEINISSDDFEPSPKEQDNLNATRQFTDKGENWLEGKLDGYTVLAKVFSEASQYGIDNGRISKLHIADKDGKEVVSYDRGWDIKPLYEHREIYEKVSKELVIQRLEMNVIEQQQGKRKQRSQER